MKCSTTFVVEDFSGLSFDERFKINTNNKWCFH